NSGAMSCFAREGLEERGIAVTEERWPRQVVEADLVGADIVVALKEAEHRPLMEAQFPGHRGRVVYWTVHDLDVALPMQVLPELVEGGGGIGGQLELFAEGGAPVGAAEGTADDVVEFGGVVGWEQADGVEDVVFDEDEHGVLFVAVGDGVEHGASESGK